MEASEFHSLEARGTVSLGLASEGSLPIQQMSGSDLERSEENSFFFQINMRCVYQLGRETPLRSYLLAGSGYPCKGRLGFCGGFMFCLSSTVTMGMQVETMFCEG